MDKKKTVEDLQKQQRALAQDYSTFVKSPQGKNVMNDLREKFMDRSSIVPGDPHGTHAREGAREVYLYIKQMAEAGESYADSE